MPEFFLHLAGDGMHVIADQADRAGGVDRDRLGIENIVRLAASLASFFSPPKTISSSCISVDMQYWR